MSEMYHVLVYRQSQPQAMELHYKTRGMAENVFKAIRGWAEGTITDDGRSDRFGASDEYGVSASFYRPDVTHVILMDQRQVHQIRIDMNLMEARRQMREALAARSDPLLNGTIAAPGKTGMA